MKIQFYLLLLSTCFGCKEAIKQGSYVYNDSLPQFVKEIPGVGSGERTYAYDPVKGWEKQLGLNNLEYGFTNLQIRIWFDSSRSNRRKLIVVENSGEIWNSKVYELELMRTTKLDTITKTTIRNVIPKSGWNIFSHMILNLGVTTLPSMENIPGLVDKIKDGTAYYVEVASKNRYRFYTYHEPQYFQADFIEARNFVKFLNLLTDELNTK